MENNVRKLLFLIAFPVFGLTVAGCDNDLVGPENEDLLGTFMIERVDNRPVPFIPIREDGCEVVYTGGWLTFHADGEYEMETDVQTRICEGTENITTLKRLNYGTYERDGKRIFFTPAREGLSDPFEGSIASDLVDALVVNVYGAEYKFERLVVGRPDPESLRQALEDEARRYLSLPTPQPPAPSH